MKHTILSLIAAALLAAGCSSTHETAEAVKPPVQIPQSIMTMKEWGGTPAPDSVARKHTITSITLHHGGETFTRDKDVIRYLRNLQSWSRSEKHWIDIPYHYIIDLDGNVYEGRDIRFAGDTNTQYDPAGNALICVLGNYEDITPTPRQLETIVSMMTWLAKTYHVPTDSIRSHRDVATGTVCPGKYLYPYVKSGFFREEVKANLSK
ncbi:MAG: peptidoglycan recognition family protein [Acidobacteriota bacterium]